MLRYELGLTDWLKENAYRKFGFDFLTLHEASWIPDTGRLHEAILKGSFNEVEPVGRTRIGIGSIVNVLDWSHPLPTKAK